MKIGDYVRTKYGIAKIIPDGSYVQINEVNGIEDKMVYVDKNGIPTNWEFSCYVWEHDIIKYSNNIIDLIEIGDYVNGYIVKAKDEKENKVYFDYLKKSYPANIETVLTKEQFESMKYEVK